MNWASLFEDTHKKLMLFLYILPVVSKDKNATSSPRDNLRLNENKCSPKERCFSSPNSAENSQLLQTSASRVMSCQEVLQTHIRVSRLAHHLLILQPVLKIGAFLQSPGRSKNRPRLQFENELDNLQNCSYNWGFTVLIGPSHSPMLVGREIQRWLWYTALSADSRQRPTCWRTEIGRLIQVAQHPPFTSTFPKDDNQVILSKGSCINDSPIYNERTHQRTGYTLDSQAPPSQGLH